MDFQLPEGFENFDMNEIDEMNLQQGEELVLIRVPKEMSLKEVEALKLNLNTLTTEGDYTIEEQKESEMLNIQLLVKNGSNQEKLDFQRTFQLKPKIDLNLDVVLLKQGEKIKNAPVERRKQLEGMKHQSCPNGFQTGKNN